MVVESRYGPTVIKCSCDQNRPLAQPCLHNGQECPCPPPGKVKISCPRNFGPSRGNGYIEPKLVQNIDILFVKLHIFECFLFFYLCIETHAHVLFAFGKRGSCVC